MKFLFVDEFKEDKKTYKFYGLAAVLIDSSSYGRFKKGFYDRLKKLGWDTGVEIKGCYGFSSKKGDCSVSVEDRLEFVENLFELSKSGNKKYASVKVFHTFDIFHKLAIEKEMYLNLLEKIFSKLPKGTASGNKNGKNNILVFLDSNSVLDMKNISERSEAALKRRNLLLVEKCVDLVSGNNTPGIIFADHVAYFLHNYIKTSDFNEQNKEKIKTLMGKFSEESISDQEQKELNSYIISIKKQQKSVSLLSALKKMVFVK